MKKIVLFSFLASCLLVACKQEKPSLKAYVYQETLKVVNNKPILIGDEKAEDLATKAPDTIRAVNDKDAYKKAYGRFCSSVLFHAMFNDESKQYVTYPYSFKLENSKGENIAASADLPNRKEEEDKIWQNHVDMEIVFHRNDSAKLERIKKAEQVRF